MHGSYNIKQKKNINVLKQVKLNQVLMLTNKHFTNLVTKLLYTENHVHIVIISVGSCVCPSLIIMKWAEFMNLLKKIVTETSYFNNFEFYTTNNATGIM